MKKITLLTITALSISILLIGCGKKKVETDNNIETPISKKYAIRYTVVYKNIDFKKKLETLSKIESVDLIEEITKEDKNKKKINISKIKTSTDTVGYVLSKRLAEQPIVFTEDAKVFQKNNKASKVYATIPKGTVGFVLEQKGNKWSKIYIGTIYANTENKKWIDNKWVKNSTYIVNEDLALTGRDFEEAKTILNSTSEKITEKQKKEAKENLKSIVENQESGMFIQMAQDELNKLENGDESSNEAKEKATKKEIEKNQSEEKTPIPITEKNSTQQ